MLPEWGVVWRTKGYGPRWDLRTRCADRIFSNTGKPYDWEYSYSPCGCHAAGGVVFSQPLEAESVKKEEIL